ncbi:hypothetical protein HRbin26_02162 [bacterium HR26]|nr:hypothetical protein HRbin26_02162 [bacterium HR26]
MRKYTASAPSTSRWSNDSDRYIICRSAIVSSGIATGRFLMLCTPRIAASGTLMIGNEKSEPIGPMLVTENVLPVTSSSFSLPARARSARSSISAASSSTLLRSTSLTTGTISPCSVATAMPRL